jgi:hypothetical protein
MLFLVVISFSSFRRSAFQKFSKNRRTADNADETDESKPNRRMIKTKMIGVMLMALLSGAKNRQGEDGEQDTEQWAGDGEPEGNVPARALSY